MKKTICKILNPLLSLAGLVLLRLKDWSRLNGDRDLFVRLIRMKGMEIREDPTGECIVFSKDRALQLHSLLSSYFEQADRPLPLHVLYTASNEEHARAYRELFDLFQGRIRTVRKESGFREDLLDLLGGIRSGKVMFLVDDILFIRPVKMEDFLRFSTQHFVPSLRMGEHLRFSYTMQREQPLPEFVDGVVADSDKRCWLWERGVLDWNYPLSVDGHLFSTGEMRLLAERCHFHNPNSFEADLQRYRPLFLARYGVCYRDARIFNLPINKVQTQNRNIRGAIHQDFLLDMWNRGLRIDHRKLYGFSNTSAHQEATMEFVPR
jgi:hypothetical protein